MALKVKSTKVFRNKPALIDEALEREVAEVLAK